MKYHTNKEDLHYFIIGDSQSFEHLKLITESRTRGDQESWLIDVTPLDSVNDALDLWSSMKLDLDDDFYLVMFQNQSYGKIWEAYKVSPDQDLITNELGLWQLKEGIQMTTSLDKWQRRGNLMV